MAFSEAVARKVLVSAGRCCCLCHQYCGSKIELHHIVPVADDGSHEMDNCIALCFDCHAEVGAFNPRHPKGRKFTPEELKLHRDNWFRKVAQGSGPVLEESLRQVDSVLFRRIWLLLSGGMQMISGHDFMAAFRAERLHPLRRFCSCMTHPEWEFLDPDLEAVKSRLFRQADRFLLQVGSFTFSLKPGVSGLSSVLKQDRPTLALRQAHILNARAKRVVEAYEALIRLGIRKLAVDLDQLDREADESREVQGESAAEPGRSTGRATH